MRRSAIPLCILHLIANALILWLGYYWLGIGESDGAHLLWSALVILLFVCSALWVHGTALALFNRDVRLNFFAAAVAAARNLVPLFVLAIVAIALYWFLAYLYGIFTHRAFVIASYFTLHWRKPVSPARVLAWYHGLIWLFRWLIVPAILMPLAAAVARLGWRGFDFRSLRRSSNVLYWIEVCALLLLAIWVPLRLIHWIPPLQDFSAQFASLAGRLGLGYLLFVVALLSLEFFTSAGNPRTIHPSTVASP
jgi:hypothetical protein